ncbi:hypothetical protein [Streptomyces mexicanus]|uniref:hypothetical protein n=1 Tax=Streptomyces mexicanus TaxID=178566 RepID=UPI0031E9E4FB
MSERYYGDPRRIQAGTEQLRQIADLARSITSDFLDEISATVDWPGTSDDFAQKVRPKEQQERQTAKDTCTAIRDAIVGITEGTLQNLDSMTRVRDQALEAIGKQTNQVESAGDHGRR